MIVDFGLRRPKLVLGIWMTALCISIAVLPNLEVETSTDSILDRSGPDWAFYQRSKDLFGGDEVLSIVISVGDAFRPEFSNELRGLSESLEDVSGVWRVDSLATIPLIRMDGAGNLSLDPAFGNELGESDEEFEALMRDVRSDSGARRILISDDARFVALNVILDDGTESEYGRILGEIDAIIGRELYWISGVPIFRTETDRWTRHELLRLVPVTVIVVWVLLFLLLNDMMLSIVPVIGSGVGSVVVLGAMAINGTPLTISTVILPSILIALGCAYSMHFAAAALTESDSASLEVRLRDLALPVSLSGLTTILGFLSIGFVGIESIQQIAAYGALGVLVVLAIALTVVPSVARYRIQARRRVWLPRRKFDSIARMVTALASKRRSILLGLWAIGIVLTTAGITRLSVETDVILWFPDNGVLRTSYDAIREHMSGISPMNIVIEAPSNQTVTSIEVFRAISELTAYLDSSDGVGRAISVSDPVLALDALLGVSAPLSDAMIEQYLLLLGSSSYIADFVSNDRRTANVMLRVDQNGSKSLLRIARNAEEWWRENGPTGYTATATGIMHEFARSQEAIAHGQVRGLAFAFLSVGCVLVLALRNSRLAAAAVAVNVLPIGMGFGAMGWLGIPLDAGTVVVGTIAFGIAVDDSIHAATEFSDRTKMGEFPIDALSATYCHVVPPIFITTAVIITGFLALAASEFVLIRNLGAITASVMGLCLVMDMLLLPALLMVAAGKIPNSRDHGK